MVAMKAQHAADQNGVIAALMNRLARAFKDRKGVAQSRRTEFGRLERYAVKLVLALLGKARRDVLVLGSKDADRVALCRGEDAIPIGFPIDAPQNEGRIEGDRGKRIDGDSDGRASGRGGDDG